MTTIELPYTDEELRDLGINRMEIEFHLKCNGVLDQECSTWDHCISLQVDCSGSDEVDKSIMGSTKSRRLNEPGGAVNEIARWITSFRRGVGSFVTDATPLYPVVFLGENDTTTIRKCTFQIQTEGEPWIATAKIRLSRSLPNTEQIVGVYDQLPFMSLPIVYDNMDTNFDGPSYNAGRDFTFTPPVQSKRVLIHALITGHGNCEFLPTSHAFKVNNDEKMYDSSDIAYDSYMVAGTPFGCSNRTFVGAVPNEHGTWYYGRNGWCDGLDVKPLVFDITESVKFGVENSINYNAKSYDVGGNVANELGCLGYILMSGHLSFYL